MPVNKDALALVNKINKKIGAEAIVFGSELKVAKRFPSGSPSLDVALGGGWPGNQWSEIIGRESHGKTAVVLKTIAANQQRDPEFLTFWVAAEHYEAGQAEALGVNNEQVIVLVTQEMELAYEKMLEFAESRSVDCIVLDSYPALIPNEEADKAMNESVVAIGARLTGKFFRKAGAATKRSLTDETDRPILGLFINQWRDQIGAFSPQGTPKTSPGGNGKNYSFYVRVEVSRAEWIDEARPGKGKVRVGQVIKVRTVKNKSAAPQQTATVQFYFRNAPFLGFSRGDYDTPRELVLLSQLFDIVHRRGTSGAITYRDYKWRSLDQMYDSIREDLDLQDQLTADIAEAAQRPDAMPVEDPEESAA